MRRKKTDWYFRLILLMLLIIAVSLALLYRDQLDINAVKSYMERLGVLAPLIFIGIYMVGTVLFLPGSLLTLAGGALFGPWLGTLYNLTGATLGAALAFLISRYLAADWVQQKSGSMLRKLLAGVDSEGWRFVAFVRLVPLFPFNLLNCALGLTRIRLVPYAAATWICMIPGCFAYTWLGYAGGEAASGSEQSLRHVLIAIALLAVAIYIPHVLKKLKKNAG